MASHKEAIILNISIIFLCIYHITGEGDDIVKDLRTKLLQNYGDKYARPIINDSETTVVKLAYVPKHILHMDEETLTVKIEGFVRMTWTDQKLVWDPVNYKNVKTITVDARKIWQPDIFSLFSAGQNEIDQGRDSLAYVSHDGRVDFYPPTSFEAPCQTNYRYYPLDEHWCYLEFGSWGHRGDSIFLNVYDNFTIDKDSVLGTKWKMVKYRYHARVLFQDEADKYPYHAITLDMFFRRTSILNELTTVVPVLASTFMTLSGFWLKLWTIPRYIMGLSNYAMMSIHLLRLATSIPAGMQLPILAEFSATALVMTIVFLAETVLLDSTERRRDGPPEILLRILKGVPDKLLFAMPTQIPQQEVTTTTTEGEGTSAEPTNQAQSDWKIVRVTIDRLFFYVFTVVYVIIISWLFSSM